MRTRLGMRPTGWFQVGWSTDLDIADVKALRYFGQDLVAFRGKDGQVRVLDAYCAHLGANLAFGGCVTDEGIQCPFHGWVWSGEGRNVRIPYQDRPNKAGRLRSWPVHEALGVISIWHDKHGQPPAFDLPTTFGEVAPHLQGMVFHPMGPEAQSRNTGTQVHPQMLLENAVDPVHFQFVHGTPTAPRILHEEITDWVWASKVGFGQRWSDGVDRPGDDRNTLHLVWYGTGMAVNALTDPQRTSAVIIACTPVDDDTTEVFGTYFVEARPEDATTGQHLEMLEFQKASLPDDLVIWDHQRYLERPALATSEADGWKRIREWGQRFYPEGEPGPRDLIR